MKKLIILAIIGVVIYYGYSQREQAPNWKTYGAAHEKVIMYSLTTCGYCKAKGREMRKAGIRYTEYFIDKEPGRQQELNDKLSGAGYSPRRYGTPILDVHGVMLPNNPKLSLIQQVMREYPEG